MKRVIAWYLVFLIVISTLAAAPKDTAAATQTAGISGAIQEDASAAVKEDQIDSSSIAPGKCGFFCRVEN